MIVDITPTDSTRYQEYIEAVRPIVESHGGRYLVRGGQIVTLAGEWRPQRVIVIEFPSMERLTGCMTSPEYRRIAPLREQSTVSRAIAVEGEGT
jgi:uncharacterized protein (DUF1330 family)